MHHFIIIYDSNWSYSPETVKLGCDLCDLDLWPLTLTFSSYVHVSIHAFCKTVDCDLGFTSHETFQSNKWWINLPKNQFHSVQFLPICFLSRVIASVTRVIFSFHIEFYTMNCISKAQVIHLFSRAIFLLLLLSAENLHTVRIKIIWCTVSRACVNPCIRQ